ncbi:MAG: filamentous hemagglutinin N-terminal domain-containing protein, partial [Novosphingobium sp.]|uniref:filamentous hemagglutinin N-terminal domain-containing protein n=1 Tax=Novosphingobium sp. TaxID=1874826 RepID=UPI003B9C2CC0
MNNAINGKRRALRLGTGIATCVSSIFLAHTACGQSLPELANAGGAAVSTAGNTLTVDALAANRVINWNTFSVDAGNTVNFVSTAASVTDTTPVTVVNRVIGVNDAGTQRFFPSYINGAINSSNGGNNNISVWLINPSGITFGPTGAFSGGSLVVSSLDFIAPETGSDAFSGTSVRLQRKTFGAGEALGVKNDINNSPLTAMEIKLVPGAGTIATQGSLVLLGEQITIGKDVNANGEVLIVAASDVSFTPTTGSPISFNILAGTEMGGVQVLGTGEVDGRNIVVAASNATNALKTLLQVDTGGRLTATADNGGVTLTTSSDAINVGDTVAAADIDSQGLISTTGLNGGVTVRSNASATTARISATGDVLVRSGAGASDAVSLGTVQTDGAIDVAATGDLTLGLAGTETILAGGVIDLESTGGAINSTATDLTIRSNRADAGSGALTIDAVTDIDLGNATLAGGATRTAAVTVRSDTGAIEIDAASASKFTGTAATTFTANGTITGGNATAAAGNAVQITAANGITLTTARALGADQDLRLTTDGPVVADVLSADRTVVIGSTGAPVSSLTVNTSITATTGNINAFADTMDIAAATAGGNVTLRSDGDIAVTGKVEAGDTLLAKGITTDYATSFSAGTAQANTGSATIMADAIDIGALRTGTTGTVQGKTSIALGSALVGGNLTVETDLDNAAGDITLGTAGASSIVADGRITINSTFGAVGRAAGSTGLTLWSNADDSGADALSVTANNAVALGNARLDGGTVPSAAVTVRSTTDDVEIGTANATRFTGTALAGTFTSTGTITGDNSAAGAGNAILIDAANIVLATARTQGADQDIRLTTTGAVDATAITASRNIVISSLGSPASRIGSSTLKPILTANTGSISAFAGAMTLDKATAATSILLRSDGAISADGKIEAGTNLTVSGVTGTHAGAFTATTAEATAGAVSVSASAIDLGTAISGTSTTLDALVAGGTISIGKVDAGTNYTATATGDITMGRVGAKTQTAGGAVLIDSATGSISEGTTGVSLTSNDDDSGAETLTLDAGNAIALGNAVLRGGATQTSDVSLTSVNGTTIDEAFAANFGSTAGGAFTADLVDANGNATITAGSVAAKVVDATGDITVTSAGAVQANTLTAGGNVTVKGVGVGHAASLAAIGGITGAGITATAGAISVKAGAINVASATSGTSTTLDALVAGGTIAVGNVDAGTNYTATATGDITLGRVGAKTQTAGGAVLIDSATGSISEGTTGLALTSNDDDAGAETLTLDAGNAIALGNAVLRGGATQTSDISLTSVNGTTIDEAFAANFGSTAGGAFTADLVDANGNATITAGSVAAKVVDATGDITVTSAGAVQANTLTAGGNVTVKGVGAGHAASLAAIGGTTGAAITATAGAISVKAGAINVASANSGTSTTLDATVAGGTIAVGNVDAGTSYSATATGGITLGQGSRKTQTAGGAVTITSTTGSITEGVTGVSLTSNDDDAGTEALTLSAGNAIALGGAVLRGGTTQTSDIALTSTNGTAIDEAFAANFGSTAGGAFTADLVDANGNATITAGSVAAKVVDATGDITVTSAGAVQANTLTAGGNVTVKGVGAGHAASLAAIGGTTGTAITATAGAISVKAGAINVASATSGTSTTLDAAVTGGTIAVGNVDAGTDYTATATGDITLGQGNRKTQTAGGEVNITSTAGSISEGATGLALTSNDDDAGAETLTLDAGNAIALGNAVLRGGATQTSDISLTSVNGTTIDEAFAANFGSTAGGAFTADLVDANGNATITAGSVAAKVVDATGDITVTSAGAVQTNTLTAGGNVTVKGVGAGHAASLAAIGGTTGAAITATAGAISVKAGAINVASATSGTSTTLDAAVAGGTIAVGNVDAGTSYSALADGNIQLGRVGAKTQTAGGAVLVDSANGSISEGTTGLTLTANDDGTGAETLVLDAGGAIALGNSVLSGGTNKQSAVSTTSGADTTLGTVNSAAFTANAGTTFTARKAITAAGNVAITAGGAVALDTVAAEGTGHDITITTPGAVTAVSLVAARDVTVGGTGGGNAASFTAPTVTATAGAISVKAGATDIEAAVSGTDTTVSGTTAKLGTVSAGGDYTVNTTGDITLGKAGLLTQQAKGAVSLTSSSGKIQQGTNGLVLTGNSDDSLGEAVSLSAAEIALGGATVNGGATKQSLVTLETTGATTVGKVNASALAATAGTTFTATGLIETANNAAITAGGAVTLDTVRALGTGSLITISTPGAISAGTLAAGQDVRVGGAM